MKRKSFILYQSDYAMLRFLNPEQRSAWIDAVFAYTDEQETPELDQATSIAFEAVRLHIDKDNEEWDRIRTARSDGGKKHKGNQYTRNSKVEQMEDTSNDWKILPKSGRLGTNGSVFVDCTCINTPPIVPPKGENVAGLQKNVEKLRDENLQSPWLEQYAINNRITMRQAQEYLEAFTKALIDRDETTETNKDYRRHFANWMKVQVDKNTNIVKNGTNTNTKNVVVDLSRL